MLFSGQFLQTLLDDAFDFARVAVLCRRGGHGQSAVRDAAAQSPVDGLPASRP